jgi:hypothetical protein
VLKNQAKINEIKKSTSYIAAILFWKTTFTEYVLAIKTRGETGFMIVGWVERPFTK